MSISYKDAGVDKEEGYRAVELMKSSVKETQNSQVLNQLGGFGAMYELGRYKNPVLVSGTDGVGTKLEIAFKMGKYDSVGIDAVAMCVNDILCHGAKPLFFLDYLACGKLDSQKASEIVKGIAKGCLMSNTALIGGETAEMPGFYKAGDYDIAGFCVGVVEKENIINGKDVKAGDVIVGISSSGVHSNGFSLIRKLVKDYNMPFEDKKIGEVLLTPTKIYVNLVLELLKKYKIKGMAHITGGGLIENVVRAIENNLTPVIFKEKIKVPKIFRYIQELGDIDEKEMFGTFNMGVGFVLIIDKKDLASILDDIKNLGEEAYEIGYITEGEKRLCLK